MTKHEDNKATLSYNPQSGYYEGTLRIQVDAEIFRRLLLQHISEDKSADLTDPQTYTDAINKVGNIASWIGKPHTEVTPLPTTMPTPTLPPVAMPVSTLPAPKKTRQLPVGERPKTQMELLEERLRGEVYDVAPHLWNDVCRTPIVPKDQTDTWNGWSEWLLKKHQTDEPVSLTHKEKATLWKLYRADIGRLRSNEKTILQQIHEEWEQGIFTISEEAAEHEREYQAYQQGNLVTKVEAVAGAVNGARFH